jgi:integrase
MRMASATLKRSAPPMIRATRTGSAFTASHKRKSGRAGGFSARRGKQLAISCRLIAPTPSPTRSPTTASITSVVVVRPRIASIGSAAAWIKPELGSVVLDRLTKGKIVAWHQKIAETPPRLRTKAGAAPKHRDIDSSPEAVRRRRSTANRVLTILKAALNHAHREGRCASDDAWRTVRAFREADAARLRYLSDDEARRLMNACSPDFRALVTGALLTGCRYGELAAMTIADFNPDAGTVRVRTSKSGKPRHVVLPQEGQDFLADLAAGKPGRARLFLRSKGKPWAKSEQQRPLAAACKAARIDPSVNFHGLRHSYASRLAMRNVPLAVIAAQLGHSDTRTVEKHYGHLSPGYVADTVRAAFGTLGIVEPSNLAPIAAAREHFIPLR